MKLAIALATALTLTAGASQATTVLTFDGDVCSATADGSGAMVACGNFSPINQAYGDGGGVDVSYVYQTGSTNSMQFWADAYSGMERVAFGGVDPQITLGGAVTLHSFDIGSWPNIDRQSQVTVIDLATMLPVFSTGQFTVLGATPTHFDVNLASSVGLRIVFGPDGYNVGIDNIAFTAGVVPEPETWALLAAGLAVVGGVARRRHTA
ncbi:MAG: PEP-CTERM sorting domain-containing protein [Roseateles sp.]